MTWNVTSFNSGMVLTSNMMSLLQANFRSMLYAESSSPVITNSAIGLDALNRQSLVTSYATDVASASDNLIFNPYAFFPYLYVSSAVAGSRFLVAATIQGSADSARVGVLQPLFTTRTAAYRTLVNSL